MERFAPCCSTSGARAAGTSRSASRSRAARRCSASGCRSTWLLVRRIDPARSGVETRRRRRAPPRCAPGRGAQRARRAASSSRWSRGRRSGQVRARARARRSPSACRGLVPEGVDGDVIAGPLRGRGRAGRRAAADRAAARRALRREHAALAQALLEPFAAALENDRRLRELTTREAAAEADRRSLLSRLGRQDISETIVGAEAGFRPVMERVAAGRALRRAGADPRRDRLGQGGRRARDPHRARVARRRRSCA